MEKGISVKRAGQILRREAGKLIAGVLFWGISVQIVLGIIWLLLNIGKQQDFGASQQLVEISKSFLCDEYTGILYPVMLLAARWIERLVRIPWYVILYLVQLTVGCYAAHRFLRALGRTHRGWNLWGSMGILTIPMLLQCHLAILPNSLTLSFFLIMLSFVVETVKGHSGLDVITLMKILPLWLAMSLLMPEYKYLAAVPILCLLLYNLHKNIRRDRQKVTRSWLAAAAFLGIIMAMGSLTQIPGSQGKMHKTPAAAAASRFEWPWYLEDYGSLPEEIRELLTVEQLREVCWYADKVTLLMGPVVEESVGVEAAQELYWRMAEVGLKNHTRQLVWTISEDALSYSFAPAMLQRVLDGEGGVSYSGRNYEIMRANAPQITEKYVTYGNWWFQVGIILAGLQLLLRWSGGNRLSGHRSKKNKQAAAKQAAAKQATAKQAAAKQEEKSQAAAKLTESEMAVGRTGTGALAVLLLTCAVMVGYYTMTGAGIMDYKNTLLVTALWYVWMIGMTDMTDKKDKRQA